MLNIDDDDNVDRLILVCFSPHIRFTVNCYHNTNYHYEYLQFRLEFTMNEFLIYILVTINFMFTVNPGGGDASNKQFIEDENDRLTDEMSHKVSALKTV